LFRRRVEVDGCVVDYLELFAERMLGDASYDVCRDIFKVVGRMRATYQDDLQAARERSTNRRADTHLREEADDSESVHLRLTQQRLEVGPLEAVVAALSQHRLVVARFG
jgi:hypothetical protein